jgi:hypothetical protein
MSGLNPLLNARDLVPALNPQEAETVAGELAAASGLTIYPRSIAAADGRVYFLARRGEEKLLCILSAQEATEFQGETKDCRNGKLRMCPRSPENAAKLRATLSYLCPRPLGLKKSVGMGDRLGLATPGHVRAVRGSGVMPIFAQQSIREMTRTRRTPQMVMDDALWGVFQEGYRDGFGSDADHLKSIEDIDATLAAGFCLFTIDPGDHVDNAADSDSLDTLKAKFEKLPWNELEITAGKFRETFFGKSFRVGYDLELKFDEEKALRAAVKYARAVAHTVKLYRHLKTVSKHPFELEMSVDETETPTTVHEHFYTAHELKRLGVEVVSLAPRFIGDFEKGIDYKGDLEAFEEAFVQHVKIARHFGPYKMSIHSGSDKFSVYPICARHAKELIHVKTAGTSYLEATRTLAVVAPGLFREILGYAFERYGEDKASYHVSADPNVVPKPDQLKDDELQSVLDINDGRQLLHVTYGSVLTATNPDGSFRFRDRFLQALRDNEDVHYEIVAKHLKKHVDPLAAVK